MLWFTVLTVWCAYASGCAWAAVLASDKPFYPAEAHARLFEEFKVTYNKQYATPKENEYRFEIFKNRLNEINELNARYKNTVYAITRFSDLTKEEFTAQYTGLIVDKNSKPTLPPLFNLSSIEEPESFDWRDKNVVTNVKQQGNCGSCWTFGIIGCLETRYAMKHNKLVNLSEKQLLDCDTYDAGCGGGLYKTAISYLYTHGIMTEADYPYLDQEGKCQYDDKKAAVQIKGFESYSFFPESKIKKLLYLKGPLAISIDASTLFSYHRGVFQDCDYNQINHGVLLVGYGSENGVDYWLVKNSWDVTFGENGYFKMERNKSCLGFNKGIGSDIVHLII